MMRRLATLAIMALLAAAAAGAFVDHRMSHPPAVLQAASPPPQRGAAAPGEAVVAVAPAAQQASGIAVAPLAPASLQQDLPVYAVVVDMQPLFDLGNRLAGARAEHDSTRAQAEAARTQLERTQLLYGDDRNMSLKSLQEARATAQADQARLHAAQAAQSMLEAAVRQQFGPVLAKAAGEPASGLFRQLAHGSAAVVRVTLPGGQPPLAPARLAIDAPDGQRVPARLLSASPQADPAVQGVSYLYLAERALPAGTRTTGHIAVGDGTAIGLFIPERALIWFAGQRWAYVRTAPDHFARRLVPDGLASDGGIIVTGRFRPGDLVVVRGAQLLLSEEQRPQGIATACKDPPECDD